MSRHDEAAVREQVRRVEVLLRELEQRADPALRAWVEEALASLLELYGEGLARVLAEVERADDPALSRGLAEDAWVRQLLLLHGLHPDPLEERVARALEDIRPDLRARGGDVDLVAIEGSLVRLRLRGACGGPASSSLHLRSRIEEALRAAAPELREILAVGLDGPGDAPLLPAVQPPSDGGAA